MISRRLTCHMVTPLLESSLRGSDDPDSKVVVHDPWSPQSRTSPVIFRLRAFRRRWHGHCTPKAAGLFLAGAITQGKETDAAGCSGNFVSGALQLVNPAAAPPSRAGSSVCTSDPKNFRRE